jgi:hypothetical protein
LLDRVVADRPGDWPADSPRAEVLAKPGRPDDREADLERVADVPFLIRPAADRSRAGRWAEAVPLDDRAIALGTVPYEAGTEAAIAHLEVGDEAGYRRVCEILRGCHPADIPGPYVRANLANVLTLWPGGVGDDGKGLGWIEPLPAAVPPTRKEMKRAFLQVLGAVLLRSGRPPEAIEQTREAIASGDGRPSFDESVILAMATFPAGDRVQARALLGRLGDEGPDGPSSEVL